ncbi:MAG TPA: hypothetical protein ENK18_12330 [Deltaproteobacteria bacterium]|nr:hypothetical protein [Deltaproteobacteria bacterium]
MPLEVADPAWLSRACELPGVQPDHGCEVWVDPTWEGLYDASGPLWLWLGPDGHTCIEHEVRWSS